MRLVWIGSCRRDSEDYGRIIGCAHQQRSIHGCCHSIPRHHSIVSSILSHPFYSRILTATTIDNDNSSPDTKSLLTDFNAAFSTNVLGPVLTTNAFLPLLKKGSLKKVLTLSSGFGDEEFNLKAGTWQQSAYCASKAALDMVNVKFARKHLLSPSCVDSEEVLIDDICSGTEERRVHLSCYKPRSRQHPGDA